MHDQDIIVPVILFMSVAAIIIVAISTRHRERIAMVEKGASSDLIKAMNAKELKSRPLASLKWGILFVMGGLAILLGSYLHERYQMQEGAIAGLLALFVGVGLVIFYMIAGKKAGEGA